MSRRKHSVLIVFVLCCFGYAPTLLLNGDAAPVSSPEILLPRAENGFRFAVLGDSGTGGTAQYRIGELMALCRRAFPFDTVLMLGDNLYGSEDPDDYEKKFERPYKVLLDSGVKFYASLGNHDEPNQRLYKPFNMNERRFYTFQPKDGIRFFALDSTYMSAEQLEWIEKELKQSDSGWKLSFFHHPIYSSGRRHGSDVELRTVLEPLFVKYGVDAVLSGHDHFYERLKPQNGISYFVSGAAGKLRRGNLAQSELTAKGFDQDYSFMLVEIVEDEMHFQTIAVSGKTVDHGSIRRREAERPSDRTQLSEELLQAAASGDTNRIRELIQQGADVNVRDKRKWSTYGFTPLMWAAMEGHLTAVKLLLESGAEVDARDEQDRATALIRAADNDRTEAGKLLLDRGGDADVRDRHGYTALMGAAEHGNSPMVRLLLEHGAEVNAKHKGDGTDALMLAADEEQLEVVKILLEAGADPRAADSDGRTALMRVVESERVDIAKELVEARADPFQADDEGVSAFQEARNRANPKLIQLFQGTH